MYDLKLGFFFSGQSQASLFTMSQKTPTSPKEKTAPILLRKGSHSKIPLKEKIVQIYEALFRGEEPGAGNPNFWDELFLLKVNSTFIEAEFEKLNGEQLVALKETINHLFYKCVETLKEDHPIRIANAIQTLCALTRGVYKKSLGDYGFDVINILVGFDNAESQMQHLVERLNYFLSSEQSSGLTGVALRMLLVLVTVTENVSQNTILEYLMINSVFESIVQIMGDPAVRQTHGHDALLLLTILVQYRKYESANPYIVKLSILDDELALNGFAQVISTMLTEFNRMYQSKTTEAHGSFMATLTNMVGSMFVAEEKKVEAVKANDTILLALYEAIHLNRNFITTLTQCHTPSTPATPPDVPSSPTTSGPTVPKSPLETASSFEAALHADTTTHPTNLLVTFLQYSSIILQDIKDTARFNNSKLCLTILTCIAEDQYANSLMHDVNMNFPVYLHKMPMRHRKPSVDKRPASRPLASAVIDLMVEFIQSHLMKNFPTELYLKCLGITHRILCYQKKCRVRLSYPWKELWTALINLLKFVMTHEAHLLKKHDIFYLSTQVSLRPRHELPPYALTLFCIVP